MISPALLKEILSASTAKTPASPTPRLWTSMLAPSLTVNLEVVRLIFPALPVACRLGNSSLPEVANKPPRFRPSEVVTPSNSIDSVASIVNCPPFPFPNAAEAKSAPSLMDNVPVEISKLPASEAE